MIDELRADFVATIAAIDERLRHGTRDAAAPAVAHAAAGGDVLVIAFGKAARTMASSLLATLPGERVRGLLVPPAPDQAPLPPLEVIAAGHPLPDAHSFVAAERALALSRTATARDHIVFLVSGGGSALLERPLVDDVTVDEWRAFYRALVGCGAAIGDVNRVRRRLSAVKGGRLAAAAASARGQHTIVQKDVPGPIADVASGPTWAFAHEPDTLACDLRRHGLLAALPDALRERVEAGQIAPLPELPAAVKARCSWSTVVDEVYARQQLAARLVERGVVVDQDVDVDDWPYERAADELLRRLAALRARHPGRRVAVVTSGELSVPLPPDPGLGGRNLQFALHCAARIAGQPIAVLSCGTDGVDGSAPAAGAVVDGATAARIAARGDDVADHLGRCDALPPLDAIGATVVTGPTGTNVRDLRAFVTTG